ncbi:MAG TPA: hypothetical protein VF054_08130 [Micromonosporaceae bacterium]
MSRNLYTPYRCCQCRKRIRIDRPFHALRGRLYACVNCVERHNLVDLIERPAS